LVQAQPLAAEAHLLFGMLRLDENAVEPALESLRRAAFLDADSALVQFTLGRAYGALGDRSRAQVAYTHARRLLAAVADDAAITGGQGMVAGELRAAIEAQLRGLGPLH
jgi:chemotaxis protein methyltransferase CheR